ncbi:MAG: YcbK family protein [bacterium]
MFDNQLNRRDFLRMSGLCALGSLVPGLVLAEETASTVAERSLSFRNVNTGETLKTVFWAHEQYQPEAIAAINVLLRDHRTGEIKPIDRRLLDLLHTVTGQLKTGEPIQVVSGYRSPQTNAMLRKRSHSVAKRSLHMEGQAVDIWIPGTGLSKLRKAAVGLHSGGVGYYPRSNFVHLDVGRVRQW